jgi:hypothetical protein
MSKSFSQFINLDANEGVFFARELEFVKSKTYDLLFPELKMTRLIPVSFEAGPGAETITFETYGMVGFAKVISNYATDLPRVDVYGTQDSVIVKTVGDSFGYNIQEIKANAMANKNLPTRKAAAARKAIEKKVDDIALSAYATDKINGGLVGLLYNAHTTKGTVATRGGHVTWATKTPAEILADLNAIVADMISLTNGVEIPDTILLPIAQWSLISTTPLQAGSDTTIREFFLKNNPSITTIEWLAPLHNVNPVPSTGAVANTDVMIAYRRSPDKLTLEIPEAFTQLDPQAQGLEYVIPCMARIGGVIIYYPLSVSIIEGI